MFTFLFVALAFWLGAVIEAYLTHQYIKHSGPVEVNPGTPDTFWYFMLHVPVDLARDAWYFVTDWIALHLLGK